VGISKRFTTLAGWKIHQQKVHSGVRHVCHVCGNVLADVNTLRKHLESRHGILPPPMGTKGRVSPGNTTVAPPFYPCTLCGRQLKNRHTLSAHMKKVHDGDKSVPCELCGKIYGSKQSLRRHIATAHQDCSGGGGRKLAAAAATMTRKRSGGGGDDGDDIKNLSITLNIV
jgi:uncharacterized Zn-finger protein